MMVTDVSTVRIGLTGFWGVLRSDLARWLGRRGLVQLTLWLVIVEGFLYYTVATENQAFGKLGYENLLNMLMFFPVFAGIILAEAAIIGEYHSGIAAWLVSKPVPRAGYVTAKLGGLWIGLSVTAILIPGLVANWWLPKVEPYRFVTPEPPPFGRFLAALGATVVVLGFFIALTGFLAVVIRRRGVVALIAIVAWLLLRIPLPQIPTSWHRFLPSGLYGTGQATGGWIPGMEYIHGHPFGQTSAVPMTMLAAALLVAGAVLIYRRLEL
jgi:ABC-type transport system involved in multi-copper enzyme maturation permease subunit